MLLCRRMVDEGTPQSIDAARIAILSFGAYLRPSEVLSLTGRQIHTLSGQAARKYGLCALVMATSRTDDGCMAAPRTKSGEYDDTVLLGDPASARAGRAWVAQLLICMKKKTRDLDKVSRRSSLARPPPAASIACGSRRIAAAMAVPARTLRSNSAVSPRCSAEAGGGPHRRSDDTRRQDDSRVRWRCCRRACSSAPTPSRPACRPTSPQSPRLGSGRG